MAVHGAKSALRRRMLAQRGGLAVPSRNAAEVALHDHLRAHRLLRSGRAVAAYAATPGEVDLDPLLETLIADGTEVRLPWVDGDDLHWGAVTDLAADLEPGHRGVREPRSDRRSPCPIDDLMAVLVPGLAFDRHGGRLGYGGGHFDRFLERLQPGTARIGVAFGAQLVDRVPTEPHDVAMTHLATEDGILEIP